MFALAALDSPNTLTTAPTAMKVQVKKLHGSWDLGYALHKHTLFSEFLGENQYGHAQFKNTRSEPGEALYQLKYRGDWTQVAPLAAQLHTTLFPLFGKIGLIIPVPASTSRDRQPVEEIAKELGRIASIPVINNIVVKASATEGSPKLKDLNSRDEKDAALEGILALS